MIRTWGKQYFTGGLAVKENPFLERQVFLMHIATLLIAFVLFVFGYVNFTQQHNPVLGGVEMGTALLMLVNLSALRFIKDINLTKHLFILLGVDVLFVLLLTGGIAGTGILWFSIFPVLTFFLVGRRQGVLWVGVLYSAIFFAIFLEEMQLVELPYSLVTIRQLLVSLLVMSAITFFAEESTEQRARRLHGVEE